MEKQEKYRVQAHTFMGTAQRDGKIIGYKYEIEFNKSLEHTGRFTGIEDGLNEYCRKERRTNVGDNLKRTWYSFVYWIKNLF